MVFNNKTSTTAANTAATSKDKNKKEMAAEDETSSVLSASASSLNASGLSLQMSNATLNSTSSIPLTYTPCDRDWPFIWALRDGEYIDWKRMYRYSQNPQEEMAAHLSQQLRMPVEISDQLYLGNAQCLLHPDKYQLKLRGITGILHMAGGNNVVTTRHIRALKKSGIDYYSIAAHDQVDYPLLYHHWEEAYAILQTLSKNKNAKVLVTCFQGINRSCLVMAAYYMLTSGTTVLDAMRHIRHQRGNVALGNQGFQEQLVAFARHHDLLGPPPGHPHSFVLKSAPHRNNVAGDMAMYWTPEEQLILKEKPQGKSATNDTYGVGKDYVSHKNVLHASLKEFLSFNSSSSNT